MKFSTRPTDRKPDPVLDRIEHNGAAQELVTSRTREPSLKNSSMKHGFDRALLLVACVLALSGANALGQNTVVYQYSLIDFPNAAFTVPTDINDKGQVVGYYATMDTDLNFHEGAFLMDHGRFTAIIPPNTSVSQLIPSTINNRGQIVGTYNDAAGSHGFLLEGGRYTLIDGPVASLYVEINGINDLGQIVGSYFDASYHYHGFLLERGRYTTIDYPSGAQTTRLWKINDRGQILGSASSDDFSFNVDFLLERGRFTTINAQHDDVGGINNRGQVLADYSDDTGYYSLLIQGDRATRIPGPDGVGYLSAMGFNDLDQIVLYINIDGHYHGALGNPVPCR